MASLPGIARAQQTALPVIGFLGGETSAIWADRVAAFRKGLNETGYVEGRNVAIEYRWAEGRNERLPALAADLVQRQVSVLVALGGTASALAAKNATAAIPIVFRMPASPHQIAVLTPRPGATAKTTAAKVTAIGLAAQ